LSDGGFSLEGAMPAGNADTFFGVLKHPLDALRVMAVFLPGPPAAAAAAAGKITHYGRYSYLTFKDGRNLDKGTWQVAQSPAIHRWE
jgi:hypothetical protein